MRTHDDRSALSTHIADDLTPRQRKAFYIARRAAGKVVQRRLRMYRLVRVGVRKLSANEGALAQVAGDIQTLLRLTFRWAKKEYRAIPWRSVIYSVAALIYFVNPVDLIPDAIVGLGFADDVAIVAAVVRALQKDLARYRAWEAQQLDDNPPALLSE